MASGLFVLSAPNFLSAMCPLRTFFFLASLLFSLCAAGQPSEEALFWGGLPDTTFRGFFDKYSRHPDSAELKIRQLVAEARRNTDDNALIPALNKLQLALALEGDAPLNTRTVFDLNRCMGHAVADLNPRYALLFLKKAIAVNERLPQTVAGENFQIAGRVAGLHNALQEPDSALHWHRRAIAEAFARLQNVAQASACNNLGFFYQTIGSHDSAMHYYRLALSVLGSIQSDTVLYCGIQDNIAQEHERVGDYAFALNTYRFNDQVFTRLKRLNRILVNRIRLLKAEHRAGQSDVAEGIAQLADFVERHKKDLMSRDVLEFCQFAKDYFFETNQLAAARHYDRLFTAVKDSLDQQGKQQAELIAFSFLNVQAIRFHREAETYRMESAAARRMTLLVLAACLIGASLLVLLMHKRRHELDLAHRLAIAELRAKELEAQAMAQLLELQKRDITTVALHNTQVRENTRRMMGRLTEIARQKEHTEQAIHALMVDLQTQEQLGDRAQVVQENIDRVNAEFYQTLQNRFPSLTKSEVELCGYLRVNLSNKDIALLKNIAPASVKMGKNRLRKKLGVGAEEDLYAFIQRV